MRSDQAPTPLTAFHSAFLQAGGAFAVHRIGTDLIVVLEEGRHADHQTAAALATRDDLEAIRDLIDDVLEELQ